MTENNRNVLLAILLSIGIITGWQYFYERPRLNTAVAAKKEYDKKIEQIKTERTAEITNLPRDEALSEAQRITISSQAISGSISLVGARFDDIKLNEYKKDLESGENEILLSPSNTNDAYFAEIGWHSNRTGVILPDAHTLWKADKAELSPGHDVNLTWLSPDKIKFIIHISLDHDYMFTIKQSVINNSGQTISLNPYGLINRAYSPKEKAAQILHQGPIGSIGGTLKDTTFEDVKEKTTENFALSEVDWIGITDKYWLTAFVPDQAYEYKSSFSHATRNKIDRYQVSFVSSQSDLAPNTELSVTHHLFTGAKKVDLLDKYEAQYNIHLFDRAIDFGIFYIITKPVFNALNFFYNYFGNFGISILIVTVIIKLLMFGVASKSYRSMKRMKDLQPEIERMKTSYADDKIKFNQAVMELYKREKVNPVSGCLPLLIQIPVFFSLYKVLYVTIEMRHAPFFGWIHDLSAPDPTTLFNLFGLLPFTPPGFLMIGIWPLLMAGTMYLQQRMSPAPADPTQAQVMKFMPLMFLFMFSTFPSGLLIYWTWNNILSIVQQYYITRKESK
jgi:YidC/Oxa1 family membrane protein insertase